MGTVGFLSGLMVFVLAGKLSGVPYLASDIAYAVGLAVLFGAAGFLWECWIRVPSWQALERWRKEAEISDRPPPELSPTWEAALVGEALQAWDGAWRQRYAGDQEKLFFYTTFSLRVAHQMKTPIQTLTLLLEKLDRAVAEGRVEALWPALKPTLATELKRLEGLAIQMLHALRLEDTARDMKFERVSLADAVREVINAYRHHWVLRRIYPRFEVEGSEGAYMIYTDRKWLHLIIEQIVKNVLQYGRKDPPSGGEGGPGELEPARFTVYFRREGRRVIALFRDEGVGMPQEDVARAFEPFFTGTAGRRAQAATGIGLYLAQEAAKRIGAEISLSSQLGEGTTVTLSFPQAEYFAPAISPEEGPRN